MRLLFTNFQFRNAYRITQRYFLFFLNIRYQPDNNTLRYIYIVKYVFKNNKSCTYIYDKSVDRRETLKSPFRIYPVESKIVITPIIVIITVLYIRRIRLEHRFNRDSLAETYLEGWWRGGGGWKEGRQWTPWGTIVLKTAMLLETPETTLNFHQWERTG